tara:strand:- start:400 stop:1299 length:900 start_codon:yes stop_codon:yes gene_type:complete
MNGIFNIDKPYGMTSMDVIREIRAAANISKVGHGGTLDPLASGVIPVAIGSATRLLEYILNNNKKYLAEITLGTSTNTYDREGTIIKQSSTSHITQKDIDKALKNFEGDILQVPPMYSAIKHKGKSLYDFARKGITIERPPRTTKVHSISLNSYIDPVIEIEISCEKGFYVRSFANDIGELLECGAYLTNLRRIASGSFTINDSIELPIVIEKITTGEIKNILLDPTDHLNDIEKIYLSKHESNMIKTGKKIDLSSEHSSQNIKTALAFNSNQKFLAILIADYENMKWHPKKVFLNWLE